MTSPHHPAICPHDLVTRHKGVFCTLDSFQQQVSSGPVNTKVFGTPELSFKKLPHFSKYTLLPSNMTLGGEQQRQKATSLKALHR